VGSLQNSNVVASEPGIAEVLWPLCEKLLAKPSASEAECADVQALTSAMARGDEAAFHKFHSEYFHRLLGYLLVLTRGREDAAREAVQSTLLRVVKHVRKFDSAGKFWSWLTVLARSALVDQERKRSRYQAFLGRFLTLHTEPVHDNSAPVEMHLVDCLKQSLALLTPEELNLVEQKYFEKQSAADISATLGVSVKAVESRLARVREKLRHRTLELLK
jgi:RNA polymerase sigma-70 factor, ECF subfamily